MSNIAATLKQQKEDFVSGLNGGSVGEVNAVSSVAFVAVLLWSVLQSRRGFFTPYTPLAFLVDFFLNVAATLLAMTLWSSTPILLAALFAGPAALVYLLPATKSSKRKSKPPKDPKNTKLDPLPLKPFLTTYRAFMLVMTAICILAVDFRLFPRRFAKVETWGTSLMDMGVGSFVFSAGIIAARPALKERAAGRSVPIGQRILGSLRHAVPLLVLGVVRLLSVKGLDYAEHVTEYGVHWNFFFTLGLLPPFVAACQAALTFVPSYAALTLIISGVYQMLLETTSLKAYILTAPRENLISQNREGIFSFLGYLAIFLAGADLGMFVIPRKLNSRSRASAGVERNTLLLTLGVWFGVWCGSYLIATNYSYGFGLVVSRRMSNLPYVFWVAAYNSGAVLLFCIIDTIFFPQFYNATDPQQEKEAYLKATSPILRAFNRNGLAVFLVANLLTGLVNMTFNTLEATPVVTMAILLAYALVVTLFAVALDAANISIKL